MQRLEISGAVRPLYGSLGVKGLNYITIIRSTNIVILRLCCETESLWSRVGGAMCERCGPCVQIEAELTFVSLLCHGIVWGSGVIAPLIPHLGASHSPTLPPRKHPAVPIEREAGWTPWPVFTIRRRGRTRVRTSVIVPRFVQLVA